MPPKEEIRAKRQQQILDAAMICFLEKGYYQATTDDIAAQCGVSKGTLYWYFKSKKEIFLALLNPIMGGVAQGWDILLNNPDLTATEKLKQTIAMTRVEFAELASFFGIMMEAWALTRHDQDVLEVVQSMYTPFLHVMTSVIEEGVANGEFHVASPKATTMVIMTLLDGLTLAKGLDFLIIDWDSTLDATEELIFNGLGVGKEHDSG